MMRTHPELSRTGVRVSLSKSILGLRALTPYFSSTHCDFTDDEELDGTGEGILGNSGGVFADGGGAAFERPLTLPIRNRGTLV